MCNSLSQSFIYYYNFKSMKINNNKKKKNNTYKINFWPPHESFSVGPLIMYMK